MSIIETSPRSRAGLRPAPTDIHINYYTPNGCNSYTGYGKLELGIARGLQAAGVHLNVYPDPDVPTLVVGFVDWLTAPHVVNTRRYMLTQSESTKVSEAWVNTLNAHAEAVLVTNPDLVQIYRESGVTRPVICVGHGIDLSVPVRAAGWDGQSRFEWLTYSYGDMRKGAELAIMAFKRLYQGDARHHLTIKARDGYATWIQAFARGNDPQVTVVQGQQSEYEWMHLIARSHCFIFPSRAEGFGMPPREATLAGVPTIATQWLGMADVDCWGVPIRVKEMRQTNYDDEGPNAKDSLWAEPDMDHLMERMQLVYANYDDARRITHRGIEYLRQYNTWDVVAARILDAMEVQR